MEDAQGLDDFLERGLSAAFEPASPDDPGEGASSPRAAPSKLPLPSRVGRFPVGDVVGEGGMGLVLRGRDEALARDLAIKILQPAHVTDQDLVDRFITEARVCGRLEHPGIIPVHEMGRLEDGRPWFAMQLVAGDTLADRLAKPVECREHRAELLSIFLGVCDTLAYAHANGVVHRDVKPTNVMLGTFGEVLVMDWGFALETAGSEASTRIVGTPAYMAPEQARGEVVDTRADVFALGSLLCEILTGAPAYVADTRSEVLLAASKAWTGDALQRLESCDGATALAGLARVCLSTDPRERPTTAKEVADAVRAHQDAADQRARRRELELAEARARAETERRARRMTMTLAAVVVVAVIVAGGAWLWMRAAETERQRADEAQVHTAVARASVLLGEAQAAGFEEEAWRAAREAGAWARSFVEDRAIEGDVADRARSLADEIARRSAAATRDRATAERILEVRTHVGDERSVAARRAEYADAFRAYGIDVLALEPDAAAQRVSDSAIKGTLTRALNEWLRLAVRSRDDQEATTVLRVVDEVDRDPKRRGVRQALLRRDTSALEKIAADAKGGDPSLESLSLLGGSLMDVGRVEAAVEVYRRAHEMRPEDPWLNHDLAAALRDRDPDSAIQHFAMAVARLPNNAHLLVDLAQVLLSKDEIDRASAYLDRAHAVAPDDPTAWHYRGWIRWKRDDLEGALEAYDKAIAGDPLFPASYLGKSAVLRALSRPDEAEATIRQGLSRRGDSSLLHAILGATYHEEGRPWKAEPWLRRSLALNRRSPEHTLALGHVLLTTLRYDEAAKAYRSAIAQKQDYPEARCSLGNVLVMTGNAKEGLEELQRGHAEGTAKDPAWPWPSSVWIEEARAAVALEGEIRSASDDMEMPDDPRRAVALARTAARVGRFALSARLFESAGPGAIRTLGDRLLAQGVVIRRAAECTVAAEAASWRALALDWLEDDLARIRATVVMSVQQQVTARTAVEYWRREAAFASVRGRLPDGAGEEERERWRAFWAEAEALRKNLTDK